jgi:hypothetical protein
MLEKADVYSIINTLYEKGIIGTNVIVTNNKTGSTDGIVYFISEHDGANYVLKMDRPVQIALTEEFLGTYQQLKLFPEIIFIDPAKAYIVYTYITGTTHYNRGLKVNWLTVLVKELFNNYEKYVQTDKWGRLGSPIQSWREWNYRSLVDTRNDWGSLLSIEDYNRVETIFENISNNADQKVRYLLHGDTGVHNFVFNERSLVGVIDPSPMIGPILYDFTYAFCSSPDDLNLETLMAAFDMLQHEPIESSRLIEEVVFQLYCRIGICVRHHPHDLEDYLKAWEYWKSV